MAEDDPYVNGDMENGEEDNTFEDGGHSRPTYQNYAEEIFKAEVGPQEFQKRLNIETQANKLASEKPGIFDGMKLSFRKRKLSSVGLTAAQSTHKSAGIGAIGYAIIDTTAEIPENDFFKHNHIFEIRAKYFNDSAEPDDDRIAGVRGMQIKFADHEVDSPLDLHLWTGCVSPYISADAMDDYMNATSDGEESLKKYLLTTPLYMAAFIDSVRYLPASYYDQAYHSQFVFDFAAKDGVKRVARLRVVPLDGTEETGRLDKQQQKEAWKYWNIKPDDDSLPADYLREELSDRLSKGTVDLQLQIQIRVKKVDDRAIYNSAEVWEDSQFPWLNLAKLTLLIVIPNEVMEYTRFYFNKLPAELSIPEAQSVNDYNLASNVQSEVIGQLYKTPPPTTPTFDGKETTEYLLHIVTGTKKNAGTDSPISMSIIGTEGRTTFRKLEVTNKKDFEAGSRYTYHIVDRPVGQFLCAKIMRLGPKKGAKSDWYLNHVILTTTYDDRSYVMPCYRWITDQVNTITLRSGKASLCFEEEHPYLQLQRQLDIDGRKHMYKWHPKGDDNPLKGFPGYISAGKDVQKVPKDVTFEDPTVLEKEWAKQVGQVGGIARKLKEGASKMASKVLGNSAFKEYEFLTEGMVDMTQTLAHIITHWTGDKEFGRQVLNGVSPNKIRRMTEVPENFPVDDILLEGCMEEGKTIEEEMEAGRLYLISYPELEEHCDSFSGQQRYLCAPHCLLYHDGQHLRPIAIQLRQQPAEVNPIFTCKDNKGEFSDWLMAKIYFKTAETHHHQLSEHLVYTHILMEPIVLALLHCLPTVHPLYKLLLPHVKDVLAVNTFLRKVLSDKDTSIREILALGEKEGEINAFMKRRYEDFTLSKMNLPEDLEERGVADPDALPGYYYRDDALKIWNAIKDFVTEIIELYYSEDEWVENDEELDNFLQDLTNHGLHERAELVDQFTTREDLTNFVTLMIFNCTAQHSAITQGQGDTYGFILNSPPAMMKPPPSSKRPDGWDVESVKNALPSYDVSLLYVGWINLLSQHHTVQCFLGNYEESYFTDEPQKQAITKFQNRLKEISKEIHERNKVLEVPYEYLLPEKIPNSLFI